MYVTRPLSHYLQAAKDGSLVGPEPPEGPFSGYLLLRDCGEDSVVSTCCCGLCEDPKVRELPFPQDKCICTSYTLYLGDSTIVYTDYAFFIPVLGQPLSSNVYYVVKANGKHKGLVCTCSLEEERTSFCWCKCVNDKKPCPLNPDNIYQHINVIPKKNLFSKGYTSKSVASDGRPPLFLRRKGWVSDISKSESVKLDRAEGMNFALRAQLPPLNLAIPQKSSTCIKIGEWYCPFIFVKEKGGLDKPEQQLKESMYYKMSLEQEWEEIHSCQGFGGGTVMVDTFVRKEEGRLKGNEATYERRDHENGFLWFETKEKNGVQGGLMGIGLSKVIMEKMKWDQNIRGNGGDEKDVRVESAHHPSHKGQWTFALYVLVERYMLRRMDESLVFSYIFRNPHQLREKWG
ncbi:uncharacterized protein LOC18427550 [Amborella trichopoda]|uniref:Uncharacterized protein n=1 Tax=Amborella trichopoda TaxID=13333 RepID=W1NW62_AMBTC|nr:uncharacterized protein LOC18427550 [Amborella trichopoda]ERM99515.1 hypothetical protein AMTR_s00088p00052890 [Amborella trichopoda]|eukprot:XP_006836662.1 uncharacterized protein LOC18427550 [Amborella trichopoda]